MKQQILEITAELGFQRAVIASLDPLLAEREHFIQWLDKGFAAGMDYLKRNPELRTSPSQLYPQSLSAIVCSISYYSEPPESPGDHFGKVANYAVGLDYHPVLRARLRELKARIEKLVGRPLLGKAFTDDVALYEQAFAARHGLGFAGKNTLIIGPQLSGSYNFIAELVTDIELEADEAYRGTCGACFRCAEGCPTDAIVEAKSVDARRCISYLTIENKGGIPLEMRELLGSWVFGCDVCQQVCPYNQKPPTTTWEEFQPQSGTGHHLNLFELLEIKTEEEFRARFLPTPVRRPKRRGLLRNALTVLGNNRPAGGINRINDFANAERDEMLREHAAWALSRYQTKDSRRAVEDLWLKEPDAATKQAMELTLSYKL